MRKLYMAGSIICAFLMGGCSSDSEIVPFAFDKE